MFTYNYIPLNITGIDTTYTQYYIQKLIKSAFSLLKDTYVGKIIIKKTIKSLVITVSYHITEGTLCNNIINALGLELEQMVGIRVELHFLRLSAPYLDAIILSQWLTKDLESIRFSRTIANLISVVGIQTKQSIPGAITGIKVQLEGRILSERSKTRTFTQRAILGSFGYSPNQRIESASYTQKNIKGSFTVKVWIIVQA